MKVKISIEGCNPKWIRADFVSVNGRVGRNLYHSNINPHAPFRQAWDNLYYRISQDYSNQLVEYTTDAAYQHLLIKNI